MCLVQLALILRRRHIFLAVGMKREVLSSFCLALPPFLGLEHRLERLGRIGKVTNQRMEQGSIAVKHCFGRTPIRGDQTKPAL